MSDAQFRDLHSRVADLETKIALLESTGALAIGVAMLGTALAYLRRSKPRFSELSVEKIRLVRPVPSGKLWLKKDVCVGEMTAVQSSASVGSEIKLWKGRVLLYGGDGNPAVQLDAAFQPPAPQVAGHAGAGADGSEAEGNGSARGAGPGYAWVLDRHGLAAELSPLRDAPALMLYGPDERPAVSVSSARGVSTFGGHDPLSGQATRAPPADAAAEAGVEAAAPRPAPTPSSAATAAKPAAGALPAGAKPRPINAFADISKP